MQLKKMSGYGSYLNPPDYDMEDLSMNFNNFDSEDDTEEASETEYRPPKSTEGEPMEIKEQMYQDKLANLKKQLDDLNSGCHPEYVKRIKKLEVQYKERLRLNEIYRDYLKECVERDYILEKKAAAKEYEEKKCDLKENLITDFEERRKVIETERHTMELNNDSMEVGGGKAIKPTITRKLRRRPNEPIPVETNKRRKPATGQLLVYQLDDKDVECDLKQILRGKVITPNHLNSNGLGTQTQQGNLTSLIMDIQQQNFQHHQQNLQQQQQQLVETRIEDGKLLYERRWFHRGQPCYIEGKDLPRFAATIHCIGNEIVWVKKVNDNNKVKINMSQLAKGKITIKRRSA